MNQALTASAIERLQEFLKQKNQNTKIEILTPDASTREYFRVRWNDSTAIACVYAEAFLAKEQTYLDTTNLFLLANLPVAKIFDFSENLGVIVQEDFGDTILRDVLEKSNAESKDRLFDQSIKLIAKIQAATDIAFELDSVASRLKFDKEKLLWELNFFKTHYFESLKKQPLSSEEDSSLTEEFCRIADELEAHATVLCHRDFHAANLMIDRENQLRIIDHQDARIGAVSYDLVSLLLDRVSEAPDANWLAEKKRLFLSEREKLDLKDISAENFNYEFDLQTVQRCLKAIGTFSFQSANRGKTNYIQFITPMFQVVLNAAEHLDKFPHLQNKIKQLLNENQAR